MRTGHLAGAHGFAAALALAIGEIALSAAGIGEIIAAASASAGRVRDRVLVCFIRVSRGLQGMGCVDTPCRLVEDVAHS